MMRSQLLLASEAHGMDLLATVSFFPPQNQARKGAERPCRLACALA